jgi:hypothetical protein
MNIKQSNTENISLNEIKWAIKNVQINNQEEVDNTLINKKKDVENTIWKKQL